jgi:hypothetical protein
MIGAAPVIFVIPGRLQRVRAKRGPMTGYEAKPELMIANQSRHSGFGAACRPGMTD